MQGSTLHRLAGSTCGSTSHDGNCDAAYVAGALTGNADVNPSGRTVGITLGITSGSTRSVTPGSTSGSTVVCLLGSSNDSSMAQASESEEGLVKLLAQAISCDSLHHAPGVPAADVNNLVLGTLTRSANEVVACDVGSNATNAFTVVAAGASSNAIGSTELTSPDSISGDTAGSVATQRLHGNSTAPESTEPAVTALHALNQVERWGTGGGGNHSSSSNGGNALPFWSEDGLPYKINGRAVPREVWEARATATICTDSGQPGITCLTMPTGDATPADTNHC